MTTSLRTLLFCSAAMLASLAAGTAPAQTPATPPPGAGADRAVFDPAQLPETRGTVARYSLTPRGDVDGLILSDGTEVKVPPHLSTVLVYAVRPGDAITVHGVKVLSLPLVDAVSITNDATGQTVTDTGIPPGPWEPRDAERWMEAEGRVRMVLHGPRGEVDGALLDDGTILRPAAARGGTLFRPAGARPDRSSTRAGPAQRPRHRRRGPRARRLTRPAHRDRTADSAPGQARGPAAAPAGRLMTPRRGRELRPLPAEASRHVLSGRAPLRGLQEGPGDAARP